MSVNLEAAAILQKWINRADAAEALADDLENQIAELCMGLDDAQGRVSELSEALEFIKKLDVEIMFRGHGEDYVKMAFPRRHWARLCQAFDRLDSTEGGE